MTRALKDFHTVVSWVHTVPPPLCVSSLSRFISPTQAQPGLSDQVTHHLEWSLCEEKVTAGSKERFRASYV